MRQSARRVDTFFGNRGEGHRSFLNQVWLLFYRLVDVVNTKDVLKSSSGWLSLCPPRLFVLIEDNVDTFSFDDVHRSTSPSKKFWRVQSLLIFELVLCVLLACVSSLPACPPCLTVMCLIGLTVIVVFLNLVVSSLSSWRVILFSSRTRALHFSRRLFLRALLFCVAHSRCHPQASLTLEIFTFLCIFPSFALLTSVDVRHFLARTICPRHFLWKSLPFFRSSHIFDVCYFLARTICPRHFLCHLSLYLLFRSSPSIDVRHFLARTIFPLLPLEIFIFPSLFSLLSIFITSLHAPSSLAPSFGNLRLSLCLPSSLFSLLSTFVLSLHAPSAPVASFFFALLSSIDVLHFLFILSLFLRKFFRH